MKNLMTVIGTLLLSGIAFILFMAWQGDEYAIAIFLVVYGAFCLLAGAGLVFTTMAFMTKSEERRFYANAEENQTIMDAQLRQTQAQLKQANAMIESLQKQLAGFAQFAGKMQQALPDPSRNGDRTFEGEFDFINDDFTGV